MQETNLDLWRHSHTFGQDKKRPGERRTLIVITIMAMMMVIEIGAGLMSGSMALLANGLHMASHTMALSISSFAYIYARRHARDRRYSYGTGKVNSLGGFAGAALRVIFALMMARYSIDRFLYPVDISFDEAILVAVLGLTVNGASVFILGQDHHHCRHKYNRHQLHNHQDHNLKAAYFHVLAHTLTSLLTIFALLGAKSGLGWMDPLMGIVGAVLIIRWSLSLLRSTSAVLLDRQGPQDIQTTIRDHIEQDKDNRIVDLHLWSIGPGIYAVIIAIATHKPKSPSYYKQQIPSGMGLEHISIEVHQCTL